MYLRKEKGQGRVRMEINKAVSAMKKKTTVASSIFLTDTITMRRIFLTHNNGLHGDHDTESKSFLAKWRAHVQYTYVFQFQYSKYESKEIDKKPRTDEI